MSLLTTILLVWLVGLPVGFGVLVAVYPWSLRRRFARPARRPTVALVAPLPQKRAAS